MPIDLNKIIGILDDAQLTPDKRGAILSIALARAVGYSLDLPTSPVNESLNDPGMFYISNVQSFAEEIVSQVNEQIPVDVQKTCDLIKAVWTFRYRLVFNPSNPTVRAFLDGLVKVGSTEFPGYVSELLIGLDNTNILDYIAGCVKDGMVAVSTESSASHINNQAVYARIISLAEGRFGAKRGSIKPNARLKQDLGADDGEVEQFVESIEKAFKVDLIGDDVDNFAKFKTIEYCAKATISALSKR